MGENSECIENLSHFMKFSKIENLESKSWREFRNSEIEHRKNENVENCTWKKIGDSDKIQISELENSYIQN